MLILSSKSTKFMKNGQNGEVFRLNFWKNELCGVFFFKNLFKKEHISLFKNISHVSFLFPNTNSLETPSPQSNETE